MKARLEGLDMARAFAILGMMLVNYGLVFNVSFNQGLGQIFGALEGRAAAVFMILAGIGLGLMSQGKSQNDLWATLLKRALFLWGVGLMLFTVFEWSADILHYYGTFMLLIIPMLKWDNKRLIGVILACLFIQAICFFKIDYTTGWHFESLKYVDFWQPVGFLRNLLYNGFHPLFPWFAFMVLGLLLSRLDLNQVSTLKSLLGIGIGVALVMEVLSQLLISYFGAASFEGVWFATKPMPPTLFYMIAASGWAVAFIAAVQWCATKLDKANRVKQVLKRIGQLSMSHYVFHSAVVLTVAEIFGWIKPQSSWFVLLLAMGVFVIMAVFSVLWLRRFSRGPIELIMRKFSDGVN